MPYRNKVTDFKQRNYEL